VAIRSLVGTRVRQRRVALGVKQSDLARQAGISPSYLNLIEHNRRRIAGGLVTKLADALETDVATLSDGAEDVVVAALRDAQEFQNPSAPPPERAEDLTSRFPGWSALIASQQSRIKELERVVETLSDRLTHDPFLSTSLHEVISTVTSIRSTSSILRDDAELDVEWQQRFHSNLYDDAVRLADSSQGLVRYLDAADDADTTVYSPLDELEAMLSDTAFYLKNAETGGDGDLDFSKLSEAAKDLAHRFVERYKLDAGAIPENEIKPILSEGGFDPVAIAAHFNTDLATVLRRSAVFLEREFDTKVGLVSCDSSGTFTLRKIAEGFPIPRFGSACPLWSLFDALGQPMVPLRSDIQLAARGAPNFECYSIAQPIRPIGFSGPRVFEATMLIIPTTEHKPDRLNVGTSCRICSERDCPARREPSILPDRALPV